MGIILSLAFLLFLAVAFKLAAFLVACLIVGFKVLVAGIVGYLLWKCFKTYMAAGT